MNEKLRELENLLSNEQIEKEYLYEKEMYLKKITRYCETLNEEEKSEELLKKILEKVNKLNIIGYNEIYTKIYNIFPDKNITFDIFMDSITNLESYKINYEMKRFKTELKNKYLDLMKKIVKNRCIGDIVNCFNEIPEEYKTQENLIPMVNLAGEAIRIYLVLLIQQNNINLNYDFYREILFSCEDDFNFLSIYKIIPNQYKTDEEFRDILIKKINNETIVKRLIDYKFNVIYVENPQLYVDTIKIILQNLGNSPDKFQYVEKVLFYLEMQMTYLEKNEIIEIVKQLPNLISDSLKSFKNNKTEIDVFPAIVYILNIISNIDATINNGHKQIATVVLEENNELLDYISEHIKKMQKDIEDNIVDFNKLNIFKDGINERKDIFENKINDDMSFNLFWGLSTSYSILPESLKKIYNERITNFIINNMKKLNKKNNSKIIEILPDLYKNNENIFSTLDSRFIETDKYLNLFGIEVFEIFAVFPELQSSICKMDDTSLKILANYIKYAQKNFKDREDEMGDWIPIADTIIEAFENIEFKDLNSAMRKLKFEEIPEDIIEKYLHIISKGSNWFNIKTLEDINNYENIRTTVCRKILENSENLENDRSIPYNIALLDKFDRVRFAILQLEFGIDIKEAEDLVYRYGLGLNAEQEKEGIGIILTRMKQILGLDVKTEPIFKNPQIIELKRIAKEQNKSLSEIINSYELTEQDFIEELGDITYEGSLEGLIEKLKNPHIDYATYSSTNYIEILNFASKCRDSYLRQMQKMAYNPRENPQDLTDIIAEYNGKKINVYKPSKEFYIFLYSLGAYSGIRSSSYKKDWNQPQCEYHCFCTSTCSNSNMGTAPVKDIMYGFCQFKGAKLLLSAPWDIDSDFENRLFSSSNQRCFSGKRVIFMSPEKQTDNTRDIYSENVFDRRFFKIGKVWIKIQPSYITYTPDYIEGQKELNIENINEIIKNGTYLQQYMENNNSWVNTQKAAGEFDIDIVLVDLVNNARKESIEIEKLMKDFINTKDYSLIYQIINRFENNRNGNRQFHNKICETFFSQDKYMDYIYYIEEVIKKMPSQQQIEYGYDILADAFYQEFRKRRESYIQSDSRSYIFYAYKTIEMLNKGMSLSKIIPKNEQYYGKIRVLGSNYNIQNYETDLKEIEHKLNIGDLNLTKEGSEKICERIKRKASIYEELDKIEQVELSTLLQSAENIVDLFDKAEKVQQGNHSSSKVHGVQHVKNVLLIANYLGKSNNISEVNLRILLEAAIYHDYSHAEEGIPNHARQGAKYYLRSVKNDLFNENDKKKVAFLIEAHELPSKADLQEVLYRYFPDISYDNKEELIELAEILQDADRLDILRYDIEDQFWQRFDADRLNEQNNKKLISAVIELNTRQAIKNKIIKLEERKKENLLDFYKKMGIDSYQIISTKSSLEAEINEDNKEISTKLSSLTS